MCQFCFIKKLKVKLWYFYLLVSGFSLGSCFGLLHAPAPLVADLCPMPEVSQGVRLPGAAQLLGVTFPLCSPRALPCCEKLLTSQLENTECAPRPPSSLGDSIVADH